MKEKNRLVYKTYRKNKTRTAKVLSEVDRSEEERIERRR